MNDKELLNKVHTLLDEVCLDNAIEVLDFAILRTGSSNRLAHIQNAEEDLARIRSMMEEIRKHLWG